MPGLARKRSALAEEWCRPGKTFRRRNFIRALCEEESQRLGVTIGYEQMRLPFFAGHQLSKITVREVDRYRTTKMAEGML